MAKIVHELIVSAASKTGLTKIKSSILFNNNQKALIAYVDAVYRCKVQFFVNKKLNPLLDEITKTSQLAVNVVCSVTISVSVVQCTTHITQILHKNDVATP